VVKQKFFSVRIAVVLLLLVAIGASRQVVAQTNLVAATIGTNLFKTVQDAINATPQNASRTNPCLVHVMPGVHKELIYVQHEKRYVHLVGDDAEKTVLTYNLSARMPGFDGRPMTTYRTPTAVIDADDFTVENITFENAAGLVGQALAMRIDGDRMVFRNCRFLGWHDTILANRGRQYFENCYVAGNVDFIFGGATTFFENCHIHCLTNGYISAASTPEEQAFGFVFSHCKITGEPGVKTYLGRPWRAYSSAMFLNTEMSGVVTNVGWDNWKDPAREKTVRYAEFNSTGAGANPEARVPWSRQLTKAEAENITVQKVLGGADGWNPKTEK
jgi:pectinesterase